MNQEILYEEWPQEERFKDLMLQYDLTTAKDEIRNIPFRIISWTGCNVDWAQWNINNTTIEIVMTGTIIFEGVRHCNFAEENNGYINYPSLKQLSLCLQRLHELCLKYADEDYE